MAGEGAWMPNDSEKGREQTTKAGASNAEQRPEFRAPRQSREVEWGRSAEPIRTPTREEPVQVAVNLDVLVVERAAIRLRRLRVAQADAAQAPRAGIAAPLGRVTPPGTPSLEATVPEPLRRFARRADRGDA
jgi:hypothetical protein